MSARARARVRANLERLLERAASKAPDADGYPASLVDVYAGVASAAELAPGLGAAAHRAHLLRRYIRGERTPDLDTLDRLAAALGVDVAEFFREVGP
jgi:hypothetical protein